MTEMQEKATFSWKKAMGICVLLLAVWVGLNYTFPELLESEEFRAERKRVAEHLRRRYGQEFIIKKVEYHRDYLGGKKYMRTYIESKDEPPIQFMMVEGKAHSGDYLHQRWNREAQPVFQALAEQVFSRPVWLYVNIATSPDGDLGRVPSYFEVRKSNPELFLGKTSKQHLYLIFFYDLDEGNKTAEFEKIYAYVQALNQSGLQNYGMTIEYYPAEFAAEAQKTISRIGLREFAEAESGHKHRRDYQQTRKMTAKITLIDKDIKQASDIAKRYKVPFWLNKK